MDGAALEYLPAKTYVMNRDDANCHNPNLDTTGYSDYARPFLNSND
jgi:hypothetical protein